MSDAPERGLGFGRQAGLYARSRPGYPDELFDELLCAVPGRRVLEAGAGTGIATRELALRGAAVRAVEPDPAMAAVARAATEGLPVEVQESRFEGCDPPPAGFDLVVSFQAWHWIDRTRGAAVADRALAEDGRLAVCWNRPRDLDGPVWAAIHTAYAQHAPQLDRRAQLSTQQDRESSFEPATGFGPWTRRTFDWSARYDATTYRDLIATHSNHQQLPAARREVVLDAVAEAIERTGGVLEYRYRALLLHAPRFSPLSR